MRMPGKKSSNTRKCKRKVEFLYVPRLKLENENGEITKELGQQRRQSALLRALIRMFVSGDLDETKLLELIEEEILSN